MTPLTDDECASEVTSVWFLVVSMSCVVALSFAHVYDE